jgi:hypothetical protein
MSRARASDMLSELVLGRQLRLQGSSNALFWLKASALALFV